MVSARRRSKLSQSRFAAALGVSVRTLQDWEQGRRQPSSAAKALMRIVEQSPAALRRMAVAARETTEAAGGKINSRNEPLSEVKIDARYLPPSTEITGREGPVKVMLGLSKIAVQFFKQEAAKQGTHYQRMIAGLVDTYARRNSLAPSTPPEVAPKIETPPADVPAASGPRGRRGAGKKRRAEREGRPAPRVKRRDGAIPGPSQPVRGTARFGVARNNRRAARVRGLAMNRAGAQARGRAAR